MFENMRTRLLSESFENRPLEVKRSPNLNKSLCFWSHSRRKIQNTSAS